MENGKWKMENGLDFGNMGNGKWKMENRKWTPLSPFPISHFPFGAVNMDCPNGKWEMDVICHFPFGQSIWTAPNGKWEMGNGKWTKWSPVPISHSPLSTSESISHCHITPPPHSRESGHHEVIPLSWYALSIEWGG